MAQFEVHIPAIEPGGYSTTLKVGAENWMAALKAGMQKLGEQGAVTANVMVDIQEDNSVHVTEPRSGRVFRIRELTAEEAAAAPVKRPSGIMRNPLINNASTIGPNDKTLVPGSEEAKVAQAEAMKLVASIEKQKAEAKSDAKSDAKTEPPAPAKKDEKRDEKRDDKKDKKGEKEAKKNETHPPYRGSSKSSPRIEVKDIEELEHPVKPITQPIGRQKPAPADAAQVKQAIEDMLADVFMRITELEKQNEIEAAMEYVLDLAIEKVPCEAGSVFRADAATGDLTFIVARGPKSDQLLKSKIVVPAGTGIAGFCAGEGVSVAVSDVQKDPRFYAAVSSKIDFETRSLLCTPIMTHGRSFGCVQLLNRKGGPQFLEQEVGVVSYLSHQAALYLNSRI